MKYFDIPVTIVAQGETEEEARLRAQLFMPWIQGDGSWKLEGHKHLLDGISVDSWFMPGVDSDEMEGYLRAEGYR